MELRKICKSYGDKKVLQNFDLTIPDGGSIVISGVSGRGKTTVLYLLMGLYSPDSGEILGVPQRISAVFQEDRLPPEFSVYNCIRYVFPRSVKPQRIYDSLSALSLAGDADKPAKELSGGMRRRVAIIRAMLYPSDAVFLDEPFTGLDRETKLKAASYILENAKGRTIVAVSHSDEDAELLRAIQIKM